MDSDRKPRASTIMATLESQYKDFFKTNAVRIIHGSCTKFSAVDPNSVDLIVTSPPYNLGIEYGDHDDSINYDGYMKFCTEWLISCFGWLKTHGRICVNIPFETAKGGKQTVYADYVQLMKQIGFSHYTTSIWTKGNCPRAGWGTWLSAKSPLIMPPAEAIVIMSKGGWKREDAEGKVSDITKDEFVHWADCVWQMHCEDRVRLGHPAPFPIELPRRCIKLLSFVGDTVLDPFLGSGSTMIAAFRHDRKCIGFDIDEKYCNLAMRRIKREIKIRDGYIF